MGCGDLRVRAHRRLVRLPYSWRLATPVPMAAIASPIARERHLSRRDTAGRSVRPLCPGAGDHVTAVRSANRGGRRTVTGRALPADGQDVGGNPPVWHHRFVSVANRLIAWSWYPTLLAIVFVVEPYTNKDMAPTAGGRALVVALTIGVVATLVGRTAFGPHRGPAAAAIVVMGFAIATTPDRIALVVAAVALIGVEGLLHARGLLLFTCPGHASTRGSRSRLQCCSSSSLPARRPSRREVRAFRRPVRGPRHRLQTRPTSMSSSPMGMDAPT